MLFSRWAWSRIARVVDEALAAASARDGLVAVVGAAPLARALVAGGLHVVTLLDRDASARRLVSAARAAGSSLPIADAALAAVIGPPPPGGLPSLGEWSRAVRTGGAVVLVHPTPRQEGTTRALCAGLVDLEQRTSGRTVVTSGRVWRR